MKINVLQAPPTQQEIDRIAAKWRLALKGFVVAGFCVVMVFLYVLTSGSLSSQPGPLVALFCLISLTLAAVCMSVSERVMRECVKLRGIPDNLCGDLYSVCEKTSEGRAYRLAVLAQGREFIDHEYQALKKWAKECAEKEAAARLYAGSRRPKTA